MWSERNDESLPSTTNTLIYVVGLLGSPIISPVLYSTVNVVLAGFNPLMELTLQAYPSHMVHLVTEPTSGPMLLHFESPFLIIATVLVLRIQEPVLHPMSVITIIVRVPHSIPLKHNGTLTTTSGTIRTAIQEAIAAITLELLGL